MGCVGFGTALWRTFLSPFFRSGFLWLRSLMLMMKTAAATLTWRYFCFFVKTGNAKGHHSRMTWRNTPCLQGAERTTGKARRGAERRRARPGMVRWRGTVRCSENCHCDFGIWIHAWGSRSLPLHAEYVWICHISEHTDNVAARSKPMAAGFPRAWQWWQRWDWATCPACCLSDTQLCDSLWHYDLVR